MIIVNDWGYSDFHLGQVKRVENGKVQEFNTGYMRISSQALDFYPITMRNKTISETFETCYTKIHEKFSGINLNWPDIHRYYENLWIQCMNLEDTEYGNKHLHDLYQELHKFNHELENKIDSMRDIKINGIQVLIRR